MVRWRFIFLYFFVISTVVSLILVPLFRRLALRLKILDFPNRRKLHAEPMPMLGGGAMFFGFFAVMVIHYIAQPFIAQNEFFRALVPDYYRSYIDGAWALTDRLLVIFSGAICLSLLGLFDDIKHIPIRMRFLFEILIAIFVVSAGLQPEFPLLPQPVVWILSVVWIVGITNSMNLLDGADGLAGGVGMLAAILLSGVMLWENQPLVGVFLLILAGSIAGFLRHNFPPARIFMGSWGSMFIGYMLAVSVLLSLNIPANDNTLLPVLIPVLIMGIPLYDTFSVIIIRLAQGRSVVLADQSHFVHRLMRLGFSPKQAVLFIYLLTLCIGINAILLPIANTAVSIILLMQILLLFFVIIVLERVMLAKNHILEKIANDESPNSEMAGRCIAEAHAKQPLIGGKIQ